MHNRLRGGAGLCRVGCLFLQQSNDHFQPVTLLFAQSARVKLLEDNKTRREIGHSSKQSKSKKDDCVHTSICLPRQETCQMSKSESLRSSHVKSGEASHCAAALSNSSCTGPSSWLRVSDPAAAVARGVGRLAPEEVSVRSYPTSPTIRPSGSMWLWWGSQLINLEASEMGQEP